MKKAYLYLLSLTFAVFTANTSANSTEIKSLQIGFCDNCNESELKSLAKSWAKPHSRPISQNCDIYFNSPECGLTGNEPPAEATIVYILDSVKQTRNKFEVVAYPELPSWQLMVNRARILPEEHTMMRDLEIHRSEYRAGLQALAERGQSFIPDELAQSNVDNNLSFLRNKSNGSFSSAAPESSNFTFRAGNAVTTSVDCNAPGNTSMFYNLFLDDRRKLRELEKKAEDFLNQNYPKGASYSFGGSLGTSGVIKAIGANAQVNAEYKKETMKELKNWRLELNGGNQGSLNFKVETQGSPSRGVWHDLLFDETRSRDAQRYTISERKKFYRERGDVSRVENPCDAQALAKLIAENKEFRAPDNGNTSGGPGSGDAFGQSKPWGYDNACNTPRVSNKENAEYIYNLALEPSGEIEIRVHRGSEITAETIVETIKCI